MPLPLFLPCAAGVEELLADEIARVLPGTRLRVSRGGVALEGNPREGMLLAPVLGLFQFFANFQLFANIFISRWLERHPKLKLVSVESGVGWIPFMLESVEFQMREARSDYQISPSEIFARQIYACSWFERKHLFADAHKVGVDNVMFQTDFPHPVCLYPDALEYMADAAGQFTQEERAKVFGGNASRVYNIDTDALG